MPASNQPTPQVPHFSDDPAEQARLAAIYTEGYQAGNAHGYKRGYNEALANAQDALQQLTQPDRYGPYDWDYTTEVEEMDLPIPARNRLRQNSIHTIGDLMARGEVYLRDIRGLGPKAIDEIKLKLAAAGYELPMEPPTSGVPLE